MKKINKIFIPILILIAIALFSRGWTYRHLVTYKSIGNRINHFEPNKQLTRYIESRIDKKCEPEIKQIIKIGLSITSRQLSFTTNKSDIDPNKLINSKTAHCVGYASFFAITCNYLLKKYALADKWIAKSKIGQIYFLEINIHKYFNSPFFKDHDFVVIENKKTGEIFAVDPTVNDYLKINFITFVR